MTTIAAALCVFTFMVHLFAGQTRVVTPMRQKLDDPFASGVMLVVWHMISFTLALLAIALFLKQGWVASALCAGYALIFIVVSQSLFGAALRLPQWILLGAIAVYAAAPSPVICILIAIALVHFAWGVGSNWPERDRRSLALAVIGRTRLPSRGACFLVAIGLMGMASLLYRPHPTWVRYLIGAVFSLRGTLGFLEPIVGPERRNTPYVIYNRFMYTPLSLSLGIATLITP